MSGGILLQDARSLTRRFRLMVDIVAQDSENNHEAAAEAALRPARNVCLAEKTCASCFEFWVCRSRRGGGQESACSRDVVDSGEKDT